MNKNSPENLSGGGGGDFPTLPFPPYYVASTLTRGTDFMRGTMAFVPRLVLLLVFFFTTSCNRAPDLVDAEEEYEQLASDYIEAWKSFYPTGAVRLGLDQYLAQAEDRSAESIQSWIELNDRAWVKMEAAPAQLPIDLLIDLRLLKSQVASELTLWRDEQPHLSSPAMYSGVLRGLVQVPETPKRIGGNDLEAAVEGRVAAVGEVAESMISQLVSLSLIHI